MRLVVLVGLPASGKSTWIQQQGVFALSSDEVREMLSGDVTDQSMNRLVFQTLRQLAEARVRAGADVTYIDSTALTPWERRCWVRFAELHDCTVEAVFFDVPLEECKRRNAARDRVVPEQVMDRMAARLVAPSLDEGFTRVSTAAGRPTT
ncbi:MAG TPA: AAA family ATPase [Paludibaculum sp.]|jgi:predicted kinase